MMARLAAMRRRLDIIGDVRGRGAMIAVELVQAGHEGAGPGRDRRGSPGLPRGGPAGAHRGTYGNVLRFLPPLVIAEDLLEEGLGILEKAFAAPGTACATNGAPGGVHDGSERRPGEGV